MSQEKLFVFGPPRLESNTQPLDVRPRKALALLVYLAVTRQPHTRDALATLLWPDSDQPTARASLRRTLYRLGQAIPPDLLEMDADRIQIAPTASLWTDLAAYQEYVANCLPATAPHAELDPDCVAQLELAAQLVQDDFLAGFSLPDAPEFDEWQFFQGEELRRNQSLLLEQLAHFYSQRGDYGRAVPHVRRWLAMDPLHEPVHRQLMKLYAWSGQHAAALRQYQECKRLLAEELDVPPEDETQELFEAIKNKQFPAQALPPIPTSQAAQAIPDTHAQDPSPAREDSRSDDIPHSLPPQSTPFIGRERDLQHVLSLLLDEPACRLLTIAGQGGIGKTRLALQLAQQLVDAGPETIPFADGVFFVPLAPVTTPDGIVSAIAESLGLSFYHQTPIREQLLDHLSSKQMLVVLDSFVHLLEGKELLAAILAAAPGIKVLLTSRVGTNLQEEWFYPIGGLSFPDAHTTAPAPVDEYEAVQLFERSARRANPNFSLDEESEHVIRICRLVEGMPLAIELAAAWLKVLSPEAIAGELAQSLDLLTTRHLDVPARHRSMRVVLEQSWTLLNDVEQEALKRISVFRGGFQQEAAHRVAGAAPLTLTTLIEKSLLRRDETGRYQIHELLRQFAAEQLQAMPGEYEQLRERYCAYYAAFLQQQNTDLQGARQKEALDQIAADLDNIRIAWRWAIARRDIRTLAKAAQGFWLFCHYRGALHEGETAFGEAVHALVGAQSDQEKEKEKDVEEEVEGAVGILLAGYGWIRARRGNSEEGRARLEQGLALLEQAGDRAQEMFARFYLGAVAQFQERFHEAREIGQQVATYFEDAGNHWGVATCYELMGSSELGNGRFDEAERLLQTSLDLCRKLGERRVRFLDAVGLAVIATELGEYERAKMLLAESVKLCQELQDQLGMMITLQCMSRLAAEQGEYAQAIDYYQTSRAISEQIGVWELAEILDYHGLALRLQGNYQAAQKVYEHSIQESQAQGLRRRLANSLCNLGCIAYQRQDYLAAERFQQQALSVIRAFGNEPEIAWMLCQLGHTTVALSEAQHDLPGSGTEITHEARATYRQALQLAIAHRLAPVALEILAGVARLLSRVGQQQDAVELLSLVAHHQARAFHTGETARALLAELAAELPGELMAAAQARGQALDWLATANQIFERLSSPPRGDFSRARTNLPAQPTAFVGRARELANILQHLQDPTCRLLTLVGPGGIGKTRLTIQAAQRLVDAQFDHGRFIDGIFFVGLSAISTPSSVAPAMAAAIGLDLPGNMQPDRLLIDYLRDKQMLLVLDNFEHLLHAAGLVSEILAAAPKVKVLSTSRTALNLQGGWLYPIGGLSYPAYDTQLRTPAEEYEAVQFFVQCARRVQFDFSLDRDESHVIRICRLVEGMPLAIELAATWLKMLSAENIAAEIERGLDFLVNMHRDAPARHRSMRAVLESSWQLLSNQERDVLARLSVFRGGFRRQAADQVADAPLLVLAMLADKSLVRVDNGGRYHLHNLLGQFAAEKLRASSAEEKATQDRHATCYLDFLSAREPLLTRKEMPVALAEIDSEIDNIWLAWQWALAHENLEAIAQSCTSLWHFCSIRGRSQELAHILLQTITHLQQSPTARQHPHYAAAMRVLLAHEAMCEYSLSNYKAAAARFEESLALARELDQTREIANMLVVMGAMAGRQGDRTQAEHYLQQSLTLAQETGYLDGMADALHETAQLYTTAGEYPEAKPLAIESLALSRQIERADCIGYALDVLGRITFALGEYEDARRYYEESLDWFQKVGHQLGIAIATGGLGLVAWAEGEDKLAEALSLLHESLSICRRIGHRLHTASRLVYLAQAVNDTGDYALAQRYAEEGLSIAEEVAAADFGIYLHCCLAESALGLGHVETSRTHLTQALALSIQHRLPPRLAVALHHWALLLLKESEQPGIVEAVAGQKKRQAAEILALTARHPANWRVFRDRAQHLLDRLRPQLPDAVMEQIVEEVVSALEAQDTHQTLEEVALKTVRPTRDDHTPPRLPNGDSSPRFEETV